MDWELLAVFVGSIAAFLGGLVAAKWTHTKARTDDELIALAVIAIRKSQGL